jgi:hypothetical protein
LVRFDSKIFAHRGIRCAAWGVVVWIAAASPGLPAASSITGSVAENATGKPLARAKVILQSRQTGAASPGARRLLTGLRGEFSFTGLAGGIYFLRAERDGYAPLLYGQKEYEEPGTPIVLDEGSHFSANLRLRRLGVVTGRVSDENDVGMEAVPVGAYRLGRTWRAVASAQTDDRGVYRLRGLRPGRYVIRTAARQLEDGVSLLPTYYGPAVRALEAAPVEVRLDEEVTAVDIVPSPGRLGRLYGRLVGASAREVVLLAEAGPRRASVDSARFDFGPTEPGPYTILVEPEAAGGNLAALGEVAMGEQDREVSLAMGAAPVVAVECLSPEGRPMEVPGLSVFLRREASAETPERLACGQRRTWGPGVWEVAAAPPPQYYIAAILEAEGGRSAHRFRAVPGDERRLSIVLGADPASLTGDVTLDGDPVIGAPVFLNALDDELRGRAGGVRTARADEAGRYLFTGLPPGRYEVLSSYQVREAEQEGWPAGLGSGVTLEAGREVVQNLSLTIIR